MIQLKKRGSIAAICLSLLAASELYAQDAKPLTLSKACEMAIANSKLLKISQAGVEISKTGTQLAKTALSPSFDASLSGSLIGNGIITDRNFSNAKSIEMPRWGNSFALEASQVIFAGGAISSNIAKAKLEEQVAMLGYESNMLDICFLVTSYYLELYKLDNQSSVLRRNIEQADILIGEVKAKEQHGMALGSDVTRHELLKKNFQIALIEVENSKKIISNQLAVTIGLPTDSKITLDPALLEKDFSSVDYASLIKSATENRPELKSAAAMKEIAAKELRIAKSSFYPSIGLTAAGNTNGPILIEVPTINKNFSYWYVGIGLRYNLASLYKSNKSIQLAKNRQRLADFNEQLVHEQAQVAVQNAYIKFKESVEKLAVFEASNQLANENYRIINNRYLNELVLISEMLDASNSKLSAEMQLANAKINVIYCYYKVQREIGSKISK